MGREGLVADSAGEVCQLKYGVRGSKALVGTLTSALTLVKVLGWSVLLRPSFGRVWVGTSRRNRRLQVQPDWFQSYCAHL